MKKIFLFPKCEWKYLLFLFFFIFSFLQNAIIRWISWGEKDVAQPFLNTYLFNISDYLAVIPFIIIKIRSKKLKQENNLIATTTVKRTKSDPVKTLDKKKVLFFWLVVSVGIFDFLSHVSSLAFYLVFGKNDRPLSENNLSSMLIFNTIVIYVASRIILKTYFYRHHYFSFILNILCIIILLSLDIYNTIVQKKESDSSGMILFYFAKKILTIIFYSIEDVIGKKVLLDDLMNIYSLLFYRAVVETVLLIFFSIPFIFVKITNKAKNPPVTSNIYEQIGELFKGKEFYKVFLFILTNFFYNIFIWLIIDKFSPSHYAISNIFESTGTLIRLWITEKDSVQQPVVRLIIYIILIFGSLIHSEMIVLNFCNMQKKTKLFMEIKEKIEIDQILLDKELDESVNENNEKKVVTVSIDKDYDINISKEPHPSQDGKEMADVDD